LPAGSQPSPDGHLIVVPPGVLIAIAIVSEVIATSALRLSDGFRRPVAVAVVLAGYILAFYLLSLVVRDIPIGVVYAIWAGAGTALIALVGLFAFDERLNLVSIVGIGIVILGIVTINFASR